MKVVIATHHFPPRYVGGVELITLRLARWLARHGNDVEIVCVESILGDEDGVVARQEMFDDLRVNRLTIRSRHERSAFREHYDNPHVGQWFEDYLRRTKPDLVHIHSGYLLSSSTIPAAKGVGLPVVVSLHDYWYICPQVKLIRPDGSRCDRVPIRRILIHGTPPASECAWCLMTRQRRYRWLDNASLGLAGAVAQRLARSRGFANHPWGHFVSMCEERQRLTLERLESADVVLTQSPFLRQAVIANGLPADKIRLVPYGLDLSDWPATIHKTPSNGVLRIGYLGQVAPPKGVHLLIEGFTQLRASARDLRLTIYGDCEQFPSYGRRLRQLAGNDARVAFPGRYDNRRLPEILAGLDAVVVPSQWYEIGPLVTLEALAARTPVVATDLPNMNAQVTHGVNGLLFEPGSADDLARQLQRLVDEPELLDKLQSGIKPVRTSEQEAGEIARIYGEVVHQ